MEHRAGIHALAHRAPLIEAGIAAPYRLGAHVCVFGEVVPPTRVEHDRIKFGEQPQAVADFPLAGRGRESSQAWGTTGVRGCPDRNV